MADHRLAGRDVGFLELRLLANGLLENNKLALGQGNQERLEDDNGLSQAGIQVVVVRVHLRLHFLGIQRGPLARSSAARRNSYAKILDHFLQSADFMKELQPLGKQHACRSLASLSLKIRKARSSDSVKRHPPIEYAADLTPVLAGKEARASWNARGMAETA